MILYCNSYYTPAIVELEHAADLLRDVAGTWAGHECQQTFLEIESALRERADKFRALEAKERAEEK